MQWIKFGVVAWAIGLVCGMALRDHPYDRCVDMYETPEEVSECVWLLMNP